LIIDDDANTVIDVVGGCECELQPAAETINTIPAAIGSFNLLRIGHDHTDSRSAK
jgi:hypothetical protein